MPVKKIPITLEVNEAEARELQEAWEEIVSGKKLARTEALDHGTDAMTRGIKKRDRAKIKSRTKGNALEIDMAEGNGRDLRGAHLAA